MSLQENEKNSYLAFVIGAIAPSLSALQLRRLLGALGRIENLPSCNMFSHLGFFLDSMIGRMQDEKRASLPDATFFPDDFSDALKALIETLQMFDQSLEQPSHWDNFLFKILKDETHFSRSILALNDVAKGVNVDSPILNTRAFPDQVEMILKEDGPFQSQQTTSIWEGLLDVANIFTDPGRPRSFKVWTANPDNEAHVGYHLARAFLVLRDDRFQFVPSHRYSTSSVCEMLFWKVLCSMDSKSYSRPEFKWHKDRGSFFWNNERYLLGCRWRLGTFHLLRFNDKTELLSWTLESWSSLGALCEKVKQVLSRVA